MRSTLLMEWQKHLLKKAMTASKLVTESNAASQIRDKAGANWISLSNATSMSISTKALTVFETCVDCSGFEFRIQSILLQKICCKIIFWSAVAVAAAGNNKQACESKLCENF